MTFTAKQLKVTAGTTEIIKDVSFSIASGQIVALQGPNGSGKTTLARALAGDPGLTITGQILIDKVDLAKLNPTGRFNSGLFLSFQHPVELPHISVVSFLKAVYFNQPAASYENFANDLEKYLKLLNLPVSSLGRIMNQDFSGGEKKRLELLQLLLLKPKFAILDELDSGVDKASLGLFARIINNLAREEATGFLVVSHYPEFLKLLSPHKYLTLKEGLIYEEK